MLESPHSAGANPGPACYGKGGERVTVTDANLALGYLRPDAVLGGSIRLDQPKARAAIAANVAEPLGISVERAAYGISTLVNMNMANGIRRISIEQGYDPRDFALICAGGATGMHITALAEELGIHTVLVPKFASCLCAFGQVISDVKYNFLASAPMRLHREADLATLNRLSTTWRPKAGATCAPTVLTTATSACTAAWRCATGQIHECTVEIANGEITPHSAEQILQAFHPATRRCSPTLNRTTRWSWST
jgi:N-methylhydantoinase A